MLGTLTRLPVQTERKVGTTSNHHGPYVLGYTRATMVGTESSHLAKGSKSSKPVSVVSNAYATYLLQGNSPEKFGLIPHIIFFSHELEMKVSTVEDGHASY